MKRTPMLLVLLLVLVSILSACGSASTATSVPPTKAPAVATPATGASTAAGAKPPKVPPKAGYKTIPPTPETDKLVSTIATQIGFSNFVYEAWEMPPATPWDDTFKYYSDQLATAGWGGEGVVQDFQGGKLGAFVHKDTQTGVVIFYIASPDGTKPAIDLAIFGQ